MLKSVITPLAIAALISASYLSPASQAMGYPTSIVQGPSTGPEMGATLGTQAVPLAAHAATVKVPGKVYNQNWHGIRARFVTTVAGWGVGLTGSVYSPSTRSDACSRLMVRMEIGGKGRSAAFPDPVRIFDNCKKGTKQFNKAFYAPSLITPGASLQGIAYKVCVRSTCSKEKHASIPGVKSLGSKNLKTAMKYMNLPLSSFIKASRLKKPPDGTKLNWKNDGCSAPTVVAPLLKAGQYNLLKNACIRHDFGYRNLGSGTSQGIAGKRMKVTKAGKEWVDEKFLEDLLSMCTKSQGYGGNTKQSSFKYPRNASDCRKISRTYYEGVRTGGGKPFFGYLFKAIKPISTSFLLTTKTVTYGDKSTVSVQVNGTYQYLPGKLTMSASGMKKKTTTLGFGKTAKFTQSFTGGFRSVKIVYSGDKLNKKSSRSLIVRVKRAPTTITTALSSDQITTNDRATLYGIVSSYKGGLARPTGTVRTQWSTSGSSSVRLAAGSGQYRVVLPKLAAGTHDQITASYSGDLNYLPSQYRNLVSLIVTKPTVAKLLVQEGSQYSGHHFGDLYITVSGGENTATGTIRLSENGTILDQGTLTNGAVFLNFGPRECGPELRHFMVSYSGDAANPPQTVSYASLNCSFWGGM